MARLQPSYLHISNTLTSLHTHTHKASKLGSSFVNNGITHSNKSTARKRRFGVSVVQCCTTAIPPTPSSSSTIASVSSSEAYSSSRYSENEVVFEELLSEFGWKVRRLAETDLEMGEVARIQAEAFHTPMALFDDLFFEFFKAEVLSGLLYKLRNSPPDRYACLVAEPATDLINAQSRLVGVVDVTVQRDKEVLQHVNKADEYLYISGIAVSEDYRRQKVGSVLLKACDVLSTVWNFQFLALRAYEDDVGAQRLYSKAGYRVVSSDPLWMTWIGRRRRVLMVKNSNSLTQSL